MTAPARDEVFSGDVSMWTRGFRERQARPPTFWVRVSLKGDLRFRDLFSELFWELDTLGLQEGEDASAVHLDAFFEGNLNPRDLERRIRRRLKRKQVGRFELSVETFQDNPDHWLENYRRSFHGFPVGRQIHIHPAWDPPDYDRLINILLSPGHAFGTGTHESTRLVLEALEDLVPSAATLLDVGTGSGILAIASQKLNPSLQVTAIDNDPLAVEAAMENASLNGFHNIRFMEATPSAIRRSFELVLANLTFDIFRAVSKDLCRLSRRHLILSGIIEEQVAPIKEMFGPRSSLRIQNRTVLNGWVCLHLEKQC